MSAAVYYFSGTGNCLSVARTVAARFGGKPIPITRELGGPVIRTEAETVIVVFPAYLSALHGVPLAVERFFDSLEHSDSKRLLAICSCGGYEIVNAVPALRSLRKVLNAQGARLAGEYTVRLPMNNLDYEHIPVPIETDSAVIIREAKTQVDDICDRIERRRGGRHRLLRELANILMTPMYNLMAKSCIESLRETAREPVGTKLGFRELIPLSDKGISLDDSCSGCGTCARVCPVDNVVMLNGRPVWQHRCEMCFACDEWCPTGAIHHWGRPSGAKYHHPEVGVRDMFVAR